MAYGLNNAAVTANDLIKRYETSLVQRLEENDAFGAWFMDVPKPPNIEKVMNFEVESTANEAERQAPATQRISKKRDAYEVEVLIVDKFRESWEITWEKIRKGRIDEPANAVRGVAMALARARNYFLGSFIHSGAVANGGVIGTPVNPATPANGQTPNWWNTVDTIAPPAYGTNIFAVGHNHIETGGASALTADRLRTIMQTILHHGYGQQGLVLMVQTQEEATLLKLANVVASNQTLAVGLREDFQRAGRASAVNGFLGLQIIQNEWTPPGVCSMWDANLAGLPSGGALRIVEQPPVSDTEDDKNIQATIFEAWEQYGAGILHKGAGYTARVA